MVLKFEVLSGVACEHRRKHAHEVALFKSQLSAVLEKIFQAILEAHSFGGTTELVLLRVVLDHLE